MKFPYGWVLGITGLCLVSMCLTGNAQIPFGSVSSRFRSAQHQPGAAKVAVPAGARSFYKSKADWGRIIDSTWGPGLPTADKLQIFDDLWGQVDRKYAGFPNLTTNWDSLRTALRPLVAAGMSRGAFAGVLSQMSLAMRDVHSWFWDSGVDSAYAAGIQRGVPLMYIDGMWFSITGVGVVPMPDSSLVVYKALSGLPLKPGDIILGYDGVPWKREVQELLAARVPISHTTMSSGSDQALGYELLAAVVNNYMLFDTMDVVRYPAGDTLHLATTVFDTLTRDLICTDQLPVKGVRYIDEAVMAPFQSWVSWGVVQGTTIGYVSVFSWSTVGGDGVAFAKAIDEFMHQTKVTGLIIDFRAARDGTVQEANAAFAMLFNADPTDKYCYAVRTDSSNHLGLTLTPAPSAEYFIPTFELFDRPIAVLTGPIAICAGEKNGFRLRFHPMSRIFGKPMNGTAVGSDGYVSGSLANGVVQYGFPSRTFYSNYAGEGYAIHKPFSVDEDVWLTKETITQGKDAVVDRAISWISTLSYAHTVAAAKGLVKKSGDSVAVTAKIQNPLQHTLRLSAILSGPGGGTSDSVLMMNDGLHGDGAAGDSIWGAMLKTPAEEGFFGVSVRTDDLTAGNFRRLPNAKLVTSAGPVVVDSYSFSSGDTAAGPGKTLNYKITLKNTGSSATIPLVTAKVRTLDSTVTVPGLQLVYGDLAAGQSAISSAIQRVRYSSTRPGNYTVQFTVEISANGTPFWTDSFTDLVTGVEGTTQDLPATYLLDQNYPNPFNPMTTIRYGLPERASVVIAVYNLLGEQVGQLVNAEIEAGYHEVRFDASRLPSGVYFYRLHARPTSEGQAGSITTTKKLLILR